ncbi:MAG TPA: hypothetical protein VID28_08225 [Methylomirabilota bacterium]|jgi:hypothetical protein
MIKAGLLLVVTGIGLLVTVALLVGVAWVAIAIPVVICSVVAHGVGAVGERLTSDYRARRIPRSAHPGATRSHAAHTRL